MKTKVATPSAAHHRVRDKMLAVVREEAATMAADEILALMAYTVGQLVALQDQRKMTPAMAMEIVARNIEAGNAHVVKGVSVASGLPF